MNLAIEYLVRTGVIKLFFQLPQSLFLENQYRLVVTIQEDNCPDFCHVTHWDMSKLENNLPMQSSFLVPKKDIFRHEKIVVPGYYLMPYEERPVNTDYNDYNRPMDAEDFNEFENNFLNSIDHQKLKLIWLWECFSEHFFKDWFSFTDIIEVGYQLYLVESDYPKIWNTWCQWKNSIILNSNIAAELLFMSAYH